MAYFGLAFFVFYVLTNTKFEDYKCKKKEKEVKVNVQMTHEDEKLASIEEQPQNEDVLMIE